MILCAADLPVCPFEGRSKVIKGQTRTSAAHKIRYLVSGGVARHHQDNVCVVTKCHSRVGGNPSGRSKPVWFRHLVGQVSGRPDNSCQDHKDPDLQDRILSPYKAGYRHPERSRRVRSDEIAAARWACLAMTMRVNMRRRRRKNRLACHSRVGGNPVRQDHKDPALCGNV